ncbi:hypothetical protein FQR65_LT18363 [Abscondita terminalis]|nr:hypothetical protein FQR65_LT18363 [Abscondita terminalis]
MRKGKSIVFDSESSDYSEPKDRRKAANIPPPPSLPLTAFTNSRQYEDVINNEYSDKSLAQSIDITSLPIIFQDSTHTAEISATSSPIPGSLATRVHDVDIVELKDCYAKMARSLKLINLNLTAINSRLENIEKSNRNAGIVEEENVITTEFLPLKSTEAVIVFEEQLNSNKELLALFRNYIKTIGGNSPKDAIYRILNRTFTNECGMFCSWMGYRNNFRVSKLNIIKYIKDEVCNTYSFLKENEFEQIGGEWFRFSKQRHARQQKSK